MTFHAIDRSTETAFWALLRASVWLAIILIAAKAFSASIGSWSFPDSLLILVAASWRDVLFALGCGVLGSLFVKIFVRRPRLATLARAAVLAFLAISAAYAVAAIGLFQYFGRPLTYELLWLVSTVNTAAVRSSIVERLTTPFLFALFLVPPVFLVLATRNAWSRRATGIAVVFAALWVGAGLLLHALAWQATKVEFLRLSPHAELLRTASLWLTSRHRVSLKNDFPAEYVEELRTFGARRASGSRPQLPPDTTHPKNAIIVVLESAGTKYLGLYGAPFDVTPTLSAEARYALVFDHIYAHTSFTYASFRPLNFSVYPGLPWQWALVDGSGPLPETLAARMKARGARTAYITSSDVTSEGRWLLERSKGFDLLADAYDLGCPILSSWGVEDRCAIDRLLQWIDEKREQPFFAIVWTDQTHDPYPVSRGSTPVNLPADKASGPFAADLARYLQVLRDADSQLGRVFAALRARGLADDTLVVVTGDHGEAFADPHSQRGHAQTVYEEELRVPLMLWNPRLFPNGGRSQTIGGHVDLNPTVADVLNLPPSPQWQGHSLFSPTHPRRAYFMAISDGGIFGVREANWKYAWGLAGGRESLYDLAADPQEQHNLIASQAPIAQRLRQRVAAWLLFHQSFLRGREN